MPELSELRQRGPQADKKVSEAPPAIYQWQTTPEEQNVVMGALCYVLYVGLWVGGLLSPLLVLASAYMEYWQFAAFLIQGITVSYLPRWLHYITFSFSIVITSFQVTPSGLRLIQNLTHSNLNASDQFRFQQILICSGASP
jgi:hypothetical protein